MLTALSHGDPAREHLSRSLPRGLRKMPTGSQRQDADRNCPGEFAESQYLECGGPVRFPACVRSLTRLNRLCCLCSLIAWVNSLRATSFKSRDGSTWPHSTWPWTASKDAVSRCSAPSCCLVLGRDSEMGNDGRAVRLRHLVMGRRADVPVICLKIILDT